MLSKESVSARPNWQKRILTKGLNPDNWSEGDMLVVKETPNTLVHALMNFAELVQTSMNELIANGEPLNAPSFKGLRKEQVFNAVASSWAHQDPSFPIRFDIAVMKAGGYALLGVKGDYLEGMVAAASVCKAWHQHHFEGMSEMLEVNFLHEHLIQDLQPFGSHSSSPAIGEVTVLGSSSLCTEYLASCIGSSSGLSLSKIGAGPLSEIDRVLPPEEGFRSNSIIKVDSWRSILSDENNSEAWAELFDTPRAFTFQPPWILALDEMLDLSEEVEEHQVETVMNIWLNLNSQSMIPLIVSSQYKEGYRFEDSIITPVVLDIVPEAEPS